tara:strand:+ start:673 stop:1854 length:1182 start_codon:yes stop_codon:yes gene_type:complete
MNFLKNFNFKNKTILIRVDFNVPLDKNQEVTDDSRIVASIDTIKHVLNSNNKVVLMSHLGRPEGRDKKLSLFPVVKKLERLLNKPVVFFDDCIGEKIEKSIKDGGPETLFLLENLRFYKEETKNDISFSKKLSSLADVYVNDAFGTSHRKHASNYGIVSFFKKEKYFGLLLEKEIKCLKLVFDLKVSPSLAIIGGAKISGKINVIYSLINFVDKIIVGGGMAYTFIKALGGSVGSSLIEDEQLEEAKKIIYKSKEKGVELLLPIDSVNSKSFSNSVDSTTNIFKIPKNNMGLDIGPLSIKLFQKNILDAKKIIWNGPMGVFEFSKFSNGTMLVGKAIAKSTSNGAYSLIGGGDSIAAIKKYNLNKKVSYISTGGGAMLEFLEGKELPAISVLL